MRTYYLIPESVYPLSRDNVYCQAKPYSDPETNVSCYRVRASSKREAIEKLCQQLNDEREQACREQLA